MINQLLEKSKSNPMKWDRDGFHESANCIPFGIYEDGTKAYKLVATERSIWANEVPILPLNGVSIEVAIEIFETMLEASLFGEERYIPSFEHRKFEPFRPKSCDKDDGVRYEHEDILF